VGLLNTTHVRLELAGDYSPESLKAELQALSGWALVTFHGYVDQLQLTNLLCNVRAGLVVLHPTLCYPDAYPIKMFEYMAAGLPVIASDFPIWREIIEGAHCGLLVNPLDIKAIANAMQWILDHPAEAETMGKNGKEAVRLKYNWQSESGKLVDLYEHLKG
jgi:glycosyltransferase involved in cell wall biosynthesis